LGVDATQENIIINYLVKKSKSNKLSIFLFESISILIENSINKTNILHIFNKTQIEIEEKLQYYYKKNFEYYKTMFISSKTR